MKKEVIDWCLAKAFLKRLFDVQNCHVSCFIQQKCHETLSLHFYRLSLTNDWVMCPPNSSLASLLCRSFITGIIAYKTLQLVNAVDRAHLESAHEIDGWPP